MIHARGCKVKLKKSMLAVLGRDCLKDVVDDLELDVDRRSVEAMRAALSRSKRATPAEQRVEGVA